MAYLVEYMFAEQEFAGSISGRTNTQVLKQLRTKVVSLL